MFIFVNECLNNLDENKNDPTGPPILRRMISRETGSFSKLMHQRSVEQLIPNDNHTHQQHQSSVNIIK
jgi:hypothetical protein